MKVPFNDLKREYSSIKSEIDAKIKDVIDNTAFIKGKYLKEFEEEFADFCGVKYAVGASNGTTAIHLALIGLGIKPGDEVITVPNTFIATVEPVYHIGAVPVFVDVDEATSNINPEKIEEAITEKTTAIIVVHLYGQPAEMDAVMDIAGKHNLKVIEDSAQAHAAEYNDRKAGSLGDVGCFSFYPGKNLGCYGDGGILTTDNEKIADYLKKYLDHGRQTKYEHEFIGHNYRLDALQAAILSVKLRHIEEWTDKRRRVADKYNKNFAANEKIITPSEKDHFRSVYHIYSIRVKNRDEIKEKLSDKGISTGIHYPVPLHTQPALKNCGYKKGDFQVSEKLASEILSLPMFPFITDDETSYTIETINNLVK
jgi:dTDP-4-amino-4,6-dideoxygalactose transaminase